MTESDGVMSAMRIIDTIGVHVRPEDTAGLNDPEKLVLKIPPMKLLMGFRTGVATEDKQLQLYIVDPSDKRYHIGLADLSIKGKTPGQGVTVFFDLQVLWDKYGLYWFDVVIDRVSITKVALQVNDTEAAAKPVVEVKDE